MFGRKKHQNLPTKPTFSEIYKFGRSSRIIVELKMNNDVWQLILISHNRLILSPNLLELHIARKIIFLALKGH